MILFAERNFLFAADSADSIVAFFRIHYSAFVHSIVFSVLAAVVVAVASSAAFFDSHTVSFRFVSGQNSFAPAADVAFPVVASFRSDGVQTHYGFAVVAAQYFFALVACGSHFACLFPGYAQIDFGAQYFAVVAGECPANVSFHFACV